MPDDGMLDPVKLLRGMRDVVDSLGVEVYENSRCSHVEAGPVLSLFTALGQVRAKNVVIATNAYANPLGLLQQKVLPLYVYNVATEPLTETQMQRFHWEGRYAVFDARHLFWNLRPTADDRLVFIEVDARCFYDIDRDYSHRPREFRRHRNHMFELFPFLEGTKFTHQWGGRVAMTLDSLPSIDRTGKHRNVFYSLGYNGHGLALAHLAGKMLAGLLAEEVSELTRNPLIGRRSWGVPSPFLRYAATNAYKLGYKIGDRIDDLRR
jgi:glycine/D-amino acid oxidase-like deaminating enzyme